MTNSWPRTRDLIVSVSVLFLATPVAAQERYDLRSPHLEPGSVVREYGFFYVGPGRATLGTQEKSVAFDMSLAITELANSKVLRVEDGGVAEYEDHFLFDTSTTAMESGEEPEVEVDHDPLEGLTVHMTKQGHDWQRKLVEHAPSKEEQRSLNALPTPSSELLLYPAERIAVGHTWSVPAEALQGIFAPAWVLKEGEAQLTFRDISVVEGDSCAVIGVFMHALFSEPAGEDKQMTVSFEGVGRIVRSLKNGLERQSWLKGSAKFGAAWKQENIGQMGMIMDGPLTMSTTSRLEAKSP